MGNSVNRVANTIARPIKEYNLYERAHKTVIKNKFVPSPKHPSTQEFIQKSINELPLDVKEKLSDTDLNLEERLRQVYVTSQDVAAIQAPSRQHPDRPLPLDRAHHPVPEYGFFEPKVKPYGKVTLKDALQFISAHQNDPDVNSANCIAQKHKLDQRLTEQVLKHFGTFRLFVPPQPSAKQLEMLKRLQATPTALPNTADLKRRLQGVAMNHSNDSHDHVPLHQFPKPAPGLFEATLLNPSEENVSVTNENTMTKLGMTHDVEKQVNGIRADAPPLDVSEANSGKSSTDNARAKKVVSRQNSDDVT